MSLLIATVITNSRDDEFKRVRLTLPQLWKESELTPSLNGIPLSKGDRVVIDVSLGQDNPLILGKLRDINQKKISQAVDGLILYETNDDNGNWAVLYGDGSNCTWKNSEGVTVEIKGSTIKVKGKVTIENEVVPSQSQPGAFCGLKTCLFTGAPHSNKSTL
jgi:hypothetical protein